VTLKAWGSSAEMRAALAAPGAIAPDVFLLDRADLATVEKAHKVEPVDTYLDARNVDIGDEYSRDALEAFSQDHHLQCMPNTVAPQVVYYNTDLVDFPRMQQQGLDVPNITESKQWTWDQFQVAAESAATHEGTKPFAISPTLDGIAPFLIAAGGSLAEPDGSSLAFSEENSLEALSTILPVLSNPKLTTQATQARQATLFARGKLGMMVADRSVTPALRAVTNLRWDVLPIPKISDVATMGDYTALCLSADSERIEDAADLLVGLSSEKGVTPLVQTGSVVPVNQQVALAPTFLQPESSPLHSLVFPNSVRTMHTYPFNELWAPVAAAVAPAVKDLFIPGQVAAATEQLAQQIDAASATVVGPQTPAP
jgi:multiple sugar transport system substrate-binding protein